MKELLFLAFFLGLCIWLTCWLVWKRQAGPGPWTVTVLLSVYILAMHATFIQERRGMWDEWRTYWDQEQAVRVREQDHRWNEEINDLSDHVDIEIRQFLKRWESRMEGVEWHMFLRPRVVEPK